MTIHVSLVKPAELSGEQLDAWHRIQGASTTLDSPFFSAAFTQTVARFRDDVEVAVLREAEQYVGFFPFQRSGARRGRPVGWKLNDFQGAVLAEPCHADAADFLQQCNLASWSFDHLPSTQQWCGKGHLVHHVSPYIDLAGGYEGYLDGRFQDGASRLKTVLRKVRKLSREFGELRFEFDCEDLSVFRRLLQWKTEQLSARKVFNVLESPWVLNVLAVLRISRTPECRGVLSAIWAGEHLLAAHFGIMNSRVLHWWFTAYNESFHAHSPGSVLLLNLVEHAAARGLRRIDLGKGSEPYKLSFQTGQTILAEGTVVLTPWWQAANRVAYKVRQTIRSSWMRPAIQYIKRAHRGFISRGSPRQPGILGPGTSPESVS